MLLVTSNVVPCGEHTDFDCGLGAFFIAGSAGGIGHATRVADMLSHGRGVAPLAVGGGVVGRGGG